MCSCADDAFFNGNNSSNFLFVFINIAILTTKMKNLLRPRYTIICIT